MSSVLVSAAPPALGTASGGSLQLPARTTPAPVRAPVGPPPVLNSMQYTLPGRMNRDSAASQQFGFASATTASFTGAGPPSVQHAATKALPTLLRQRSVPVPVDVMCGPFDSELARQKFGTSPNALDGPDLRKRSGKSQPLPGMRYSTYSSSAEQSFDSTCEDDAASTRASTSIEDVADVAHSIFERIDVSVYGSISKLRLLTAVQDDPAVAAFVLPAKYRSQALSDEELIDVVIDVFDHITNGGTRMSCLEFVEYFCYVATAPQAQLTRSEQRVLIIQPGLGRELRSPQVASLLQTDFQVKWPLNLPDPDDSGFCVNLYLNQLGQVLDEFQPSVLVCAAQGGAYGVALWQAGLWQGPTIMINVHPTCVDLPKNSRVVVAHGSEDVVCFKSRTDLEELVSTGAENQCFLYYAGSGGQPDASTAQRARDGDTHNMESLSSYDCLARLVDAVLVQQQSPEVHMLRTGILGQLSSARLAAERWLGLHPGQWKKRVWATPATAMDALGQSSAAILDVPRESEEFAKVEAVVRATPQAKSHYWGASDAAWSRQLRILQVQRVENRVQQQAACAYCESVRASLEDQGLTFEPGLHTRWVFHGTEASTIDAVATCALGGFQPLLSGARAPSVWGAGTYVARDAKYIGDGHFCRKAQDGSRQMLMCLATTGMPCLGEAEHRGILPFRQGWHPYNSSVDSLANPEIHVLQHASALCAAYIITYAS